MDINNYKQPAVNQNSNLSLENTADNYNSTSYLQSATNYIWSAFKPITNIADRAIGLFNNDLIPVAEFCTLLEQEDQENAAHKVKDILSKYGYHRCKSWVFTPMGENKKTPIELAYRMCDDNSNFAVLKAIVNTLEQKHKEYDWNSTPLSWLGLQEDPQIDSNKINFSIFRCINNAYIGTNYNLQDLLYCYENYPNACFSNPICNGGAMLLQCMRTGNLATLKNLLQLLQNNPYYPGTKQLRSSYISLFNNLTKLQKEPFDQSSIFGRLEEVFRCPNHGLFNVNLYYSRKFGEEKNDVTDENISYIIAEELLKFLFTENLLSKQHPSVKDLIHPLYFGDFEKIITTKDSEAKYPYCNALYALFFNETYRKTQASK